MASPGDKDIGSAGVAPFGEADSPQATGGLSWSWELDLSAVVDAMTGLAPWLRPADEDESAAPDADPATNVEPATDAFPAADPLPVLDQLPATDVEPAAGPLPATDPPPVTEADEAACQEAIAAWREDEIPLDVVAGRVAESLPVGPGLAGWLA